MNVSNVIVQMNISQFVVLMVKLTQTNVLWTVLRLHFNTLVSVKINVKINAITTISQFVLKEEKLTEINVILIVTRLILLIMKVNVWIREKIVYVQLFMIHIVVQMERLILMNAKSNVTM